MHICMCPITPKVSEFCEFPSLGFSFVSREIFGMQYVGIPSLKHFVRKVSISVFVNNEYRILYTKNNDTVCIRLKALMSIHDYHLVRVDCN